MKNVAVYREVNEKTLMSLRKQYRRRSEIEYKRQILTYSPEAGDLSDCAEREAEGENSSGSAFGDCCYYYYVSTLRARKKNLSKKFAHRVADDHQPRAERSFASEWLLLLRVRLEDQQNGLS